MVLRDGAAHAVDSNELAFRLAARGAFRQGRVGCVGGVMHVSYVYVYICILR